MASLPILDGNLPADVLLDILQLLPAKELCRLRTVRRSWRSLTSDQAFIREHTDRHREPLFLAKSRDVPTHVYIVDLSGNVIKRIAGVDGGYQVLRTRLNLACLATTWMNNCLVLNPATGRIHTAADYMNGMMIMRKHNPFASFVLGLVASTRKYKLLSLRHGFGMGGGILRDVEVLTINGDTDWRRRPLGRQLHAVDTLSGVVVDGVVYFLTCANHIMGLYDTDNAGMPVFHIRSFDPAREEWRRDLRGPSGTGNLTSGKVLLSQLTLADLKGSLVLAHHPRHPLIMDLWFLLDFDGGLWVKEHSIQTESVTSGLAAQYHLRPLLALDDGRLVIYLAPMGQLFICDPGTNTLTQVAMRRLHSIAVYTGSLLSVQEGDMVLSCCSLACLS